MLSIIEAPVPVIAKVDGIAAAAGCQLVASCDIVIATNRSTFSTPGWFTFYCILSVVISFITIQNINFFFLIYSANFGIFCSTPGIALSRCVGRKAAARMLLTGMSVSADEAFQIGLVSKVCTESLLGN